MKKYHSYRSKLVFSLFEEKLYLLPNPRQSCTLSQALDENKLLVEEASAQEIACLFTSFVGPAETLLEGLRKRTRVAKT